MWLLFTEGLEKSSVVRVLLADRQGFDGELEFLGLAQQLHQHKGAGFAVVGLVHALDARQRAAGNAHAVAGLKQTRHG